MRHASKAFRRRVILSGGIVATLLLGAIGGATAQIIGIGSDTFLLPAGQDLFDSELLLDVRMGGMQDVVTLNGPTIIRHGEPHDVGGTRTIDTEILQLNLQGSSPLLGPVQLTLSPTPSQGMIQGAADPDGDILYPAESFFDVFTELTLPDQNQHVMNTSPLRLTGMASDENLPDDEHRSLGSATLVDEDGDEQGEIRSVRWVPRPPVERKLSRVIVKKINKIIRYVLQIQPVEPPTPPEVLVASKSFVVDVPAKGRRAVGAGVTEEGDILVENPFERDANIKICVDATSLVSQKHENSKVLFLLDAAGDGDFAPYALPAHGPELFLLKNTCIIVAAREFQILLTNKRNVAQPVELAIIWTTGQVIP